LALLVFAVMICVRVLVAGAIELTPSHLVERGFRRRSIPWSRIQDIDVHRGRVQVWSDDGAVHRLAAPIPKGWYWPGDRFDTEYNQLGQWWVEHRGADWQRLPGNPWASPGSRRAALDNPWVRRGGWPRSGSQVAGPAYPNDAGRRSGSVV
jgi:hypothetical protein